MTTNDVHAAASAATPLRTPIDLPTPLLGGMTPAAFMRRHWQKKPLLIRQALPGAAPPISRAALFELASRDDVESRLIAHEGEMAGEGWRLRHGPLPRRALPPLTRPHWTLLVQGLDLHVPAAHDLLQRFRFVPDARLDDLMISYATDGGGVGPHFDSYDVFLLQVHGRRRWRIGRMGDDTLVPGMPLKILANFEAEQEWVLEPGDMLYLPPRWAHDGVAEGECMTCSIGFRAPEAQGLAAELLTRVGEHLDSDRRSLYRDAGQEATERPGEIPAALQAFAVEAVRRVLADPDELAAALGELMSEPKPNVWFQAAAGAAGAAEVGAGQGVALDARTRMLYDARRIYANGESWRAAGADARLLRRLADARRLTAREVSRASPAVRELLAQWAEDGWLHMEG